MTTITKTITRIVKIPADVKHKGVNTLTVTLRWFCPVCGKPRGEVRADKYYQGKQRLPFDVWRNKCGHIDTYSQVRQEAKDNGLNGEKAARMPNDVGLWEGVS